MGQPHHLVGGIECILLFAFKKRRIKKTKKNMPISSTVNAMVHNNPLISGNCELSRISFIVIVDHAVTTTCTRENVLEAFRATGSISFSPDQIELNDYPSTTAPDLQTESPVTILCSECLVKKVELHPLVRQEVIPKKLAAAFTYTPPPKMTRTQSSDEGNPCYYIRRS